LYTAVLATVLGKAALVVNIWTKYHVIAIPGSMIIWMVFVAAYATAAPKLGFSTEYQGVVERLFTSPIFWLQGLVLPILCLSRDFAWK
jgi:phospholipid-transporting ATPase